MTKFDCAAPDPNPHGASFPVPRNACDCHAHIIGPAKMHPFVDDRSYTPPDALLVDYLHLTRTLGLERAVLVQPSMHGTDNSVMLDAMRRAAETGGPQMRGIATVRNHCSDNELQELHERGIRGVRVNLIYRGAEQDLSTVPLLAAQLKKSGWCLELLLDVSEAGHQLFEFEKFGVPIVVDHLGHMPARKGVHDAGFQALLETVKRGNTWVKLSGAYRLADGKLFPKVEIVMLAHALVAAGPSRMLWGTDWPHTMCPTPMPNDGDLLDLLAEWAPDEHIRNLILVENPAVLYAFDRA